MAFFGNISRSLMDWIASTFMAGQQLADRPADHSNEGLHQTRGFHRAEGDIERDRHVRSTSLYNLGDGIRSRRPSSSPRARPPWERGRPPSTVATTKNVARASSP